jgi:two-component system phosphate regulon sensor histidine kinase PhoR
MREMLLVSADVVGKMTLEVIRDAALVELLDAARRRPEEAAHGEIEVLGLKPRRFLVRAELLDVEPGGVLVVFYDVTDLRRLESLRRDFVANASHELRTPVTLVRSAAETVVSIPERDKDARERFIGIIVRNAERLQHLIDDLLDLSKIESRELDLATDPVDLRALAERVALLLAEPATKTGTRFVVDIAENAPKPSADARALEQILMNLADNAIKYGPGCTVTIRATRHDDLVALEVADDGPGIEAQHLGRLFERFYRVDTGRSRQLGGTGLGLAIVKHLAEAMGGSAEVESAVGRGTTFRIELPLDRAPSSRPPPTTEARDAG